MKKNEKGSITIYVLCSCLLILLVLVSGFVRNQSKITSQIKQQQLIEQQYNDDDMMDQIYGNIIENIENNDWHTWLSEAGVDYNQYTSLNNFVTNATQTDKTNVAKNDRARSYLLSNEALINKLKATTDYESKMVSFLLSTDKTKNTENYNAGLPAYITKGNVLYLGGNWINHIAGLGSFDFSNTNYISGNISHTEGYAAYTVTSDMIDISNFSTLVLNAYRSLTGSGTSYCSFGTRDIGSTQFENKYGKYIDSASSNNYKIALGSGSYYFGLTVITYGGTITSYLNYSYIY